MRASPTLVVQVLVSMVVMQPLRVDFVLETDGGAPRRAGLHCTRSVRLPGAWLAARSRSARGCYHPRHGGTVCSTHRSWSSTRITNRSTSVTSGVPSTCSARRRRSCSSATTRSSTRRRLAIPAPSVIRLVYLVRRPRPRVKLSRREVFARDAHTCQYCGDVDPRPDHRPRRPQAPRRPARVGEPGHRLPRLQPPQGEQDAGRGADGAAPRARAPRAPTCATCTAPTSPMSRTTPGEATSS